MSIATLISYVIGSLLLKGMHFYDKYKKKLLIQPQNSTCLISVGSIKGDWFATEENLTILSTLETFTIINDFLKPYYKVTTLMKPENSVSFDEFIFDGPISNVRTKSFLCDKFPDLKQHIVYRGKAEERFKLKLPKDFFVLDNDGFVGYALHTKNGVVKILDQHSENIDYAILIRKVIDYPTRKTIHAIFGSSLFATQSGCSFFVEHYKDTLKDFKKGKNYFIANEKSEQSHFEIASLSLAIIG